MQRRQLLTLASLPLAAALPARAQTAPEPPAPAEPWQERPELQALFKQQHTVGTLVVFDGATSRWQVVNAARAYERFVPASTFKIPNTLIALDSGEAIDDRHPYLWDGQRRWLDDWNRDQTLTSAFRVSAVWVYQDIARHVGATRMQRYLQAFRYGNARITPKLDSFWLDGDLRISAVEQVEFLRRLHEGRLPIAARTLELGRRVMLREQGPGWRLYAKTGWANDVKPAVGWYVGWLEREDGTACSFALNLEMRRDELAPQREAIARAMLRELGLLPN
jgi:beta-lactamase class D